MRFNVSQLLQEPVGGTRFYPMEETSDALAEGRPVSGAVTMLRTHRSVLVSGKLNTSVRLTCSRCLEEFDQPLQVEFEEEYFPTVDIASGAHLAEPEEEGGFTIDARQELDLDEALRQYGLLDIPMLPLCRPNCAGLCPRCGHNLNLGPCACLE